MISHEFRSPLAVIDAGVQLLSVKLASVSDNDQILARIHRGVRRLSSFLDNCLTEDRLNSKCLTLASSTINLHELTASLKDSVNLILGHQLITELVAPLPTLNADPQLLRILLLNLLSNAIKYSSPESKIRLRIRCNDRFCIFKVIDQGQGIPEDEQLLVFDKYTRGRNVAVVAGAGLGLSLVKRIVDLHQGKIRITSRVNVGTCVTVILPLTLAINLTTGQAL